MSVSDAYSHDNIDTKPIDGKAFCERLIQTISDEVALLRDTRGIIPGLAVILVGNNPASEVYVNNKVKQTRRVGMQSFVHALPATTTERDLLDLVNKLNHEKQIHGILVQLPLPQSINAQTILQAISPHKDVDGLGPVNMGRMMVGLPSLLPCTPFGCLLLLRHTLGSMEGKHAVVIGASNLVGKPMALLLLQEKCTVSVAHLCTRNLPELTRQGDILVVATGHHELIRGSWIKIGSTIIDVGITRITTETGKTRLVGDVAFGEALGRAEYITPVPGGVGPVTIACLLSNTVQATYLCVDGAGAFRPFPSF